MVTQPNIRCNVLLSAINNMKEHIEHYFYKPSVELQKLMHAIRTLPQRAFTADIYPLDPTLHPDFKMRASTDAALPEVNALAKRAIAHDWAV